MFLFQYVPGSCNLKFHHACFGVFFWKEYYLRKTINIRKKTIKEKVILCKSCFRRRQHLAKINFIVKRCWSIGVARDGKIWGSYEERRPTLGATSLHLQLWLLSSDRMLVSDQNQPNTPKMICWTNNCTADITDCYSHTSHKRKG